MIQRSSESGESGDRALAAPAYCEVHEVCVKEMAELSTALVRLVEAAAAAAIALPNEDTAIVETQARAALESCSELAMAAATKQTERALHILHKLNNKLTGSMSLTMLAREDLPPGSPLDATLARVEVLARAAALAARVVADAVQLQANDASG